ncbi:hypothetical protein ACUNV4_01370 [Granulosicoccus sp. 3-233]
MSGAPLRQSGKGRHCHPDGVGECRETGSELADLVEVDPRW